MRTAVAWDRVEAARKAIAEDGLFVEGRYAGSRRAHPAAAIERDARNALIRILTTLDLDPDIEGGDFLAL